ncbi:MAG: pyridoxine 5'-phosphate synthase [SAR116 cluster bacterium]|nr:pyridoxine 5'-phosphate synthase [SAR116 cluster bacterium]
MSRYIKLGVNIDHVATLRNARGGNYPNVVQSAKVAEQSGADSITVHIREDRRHINETDLENLLDTINVPLNLEIAAKEETVAIALKNQPKSVCFVPENRQEITTEGGLDVKKNFNHLKQMIDPMLKTDIKISLFIDPSEEQLYATKDLGVNTIELHTGAYANAFEKNIDLEFELNRLQSSAMLAEDLSLNCHAGHGLNFENVVSIAKIKNILELNIGHFIIADSIFNGLQNSIQKMKNIINEASK